MADQLTEEQIAEFKVSRISIFLLSRSLTLALTPRSLFPPQPLPTVLFSPFLLCTFRTFPFPRTILPKALTGLPI